MSFKHFEEASITGDPAIYDNMDKPGGYYHKWDKPAREEQILHHSICIIKLMEAENRIGVARALVDNKNVLVKGCKISVLQDECLRDRLYSILLIVNNASYP